MARPTKEQKRRERIAAAVTKMTPETVNKLEAAFALDATVEEACFYAEISAKTYYNWVERNPDLLQRFQAIRNKPVLAARQTVVNSLATDPQMAMRYLERKRPDEFRPQSKVEHSGKIESESPVADQAARDVVSKFEEELKAIILAGRKDRAGKQPGAASK